MSANETNNSANKIIRNIKPEDNKEIAIIIRSCLTEFGANKPGTVYYDASTDNLFQLFTQYNSSYFIAELDGIIVGGGGIFPSDGLPDDTCELVKMYLLPTARQTGLGAALMLKCLETAKANGFKKIYLESMPELKRAISVYEKFDFQFLDKPMGNTGHHGCSVWMYRDL
jgi:putative acetyltransferase